MHYNLLPHIEVLHSVEQVIIRGRLGDAVTTNQSTYICICMHAHSIKFAIKDPWSMHET